MALSKPVIVTNSGGNPELVQDGVNGFLIPVNDYKYCSDLIKKFINDDTLKFNMGKAGNEIVKKKFSIEEMKNQYLKVYNLINCEK